MFAIVHFKVAPECGDPSWKSLITCLQIFPDKNGGSVCYSLIAPLKDAILRDVSQSEEKMFAKQGHATYTNQFAATKPMQCR